MPPPPVDAITTTHHHPPYLPQESNGWMQTQSSFNVVELAAQVAWLTVLPAHSLEALLTLLIVSVATAWKTLMYMSILYWAKDPVLSVPGLACLGWQPAEANAAAVAAALAKDGCAVIS